jgi:putative colanic acid biosynthesis acetyltransferase WcaF
MSSPVIQPPIIRRGVLRFLIPTRASAELFHNRVLTHVPWVWLRLAYLRLLGLRFGPHTYMHGDCELMYPHNIKLDSPVHIGRWCLLDGRGGLTIGSNAVLGPRCIVLTADHDMQAPDFHGRLGEVRIGPRVFVGAGATILKGVTIGEGAVISAGAVVNRDVEPWTIVGGVPAKPVGMRNPDQTYHLDIGPRWY